MFVRFAPAITLLTLTVPVIAGLAGTVLPAFGYLPPLGGLSLSLEHFAELAAQPGIGRAAWSAFFTGLVATAISLALVSLFVAGWHGTRLFALMQQAISPLLAVPHAAAAFGLVFMIAPSGFLARLFSPWATGWTRPPDWLIINDPGGWALIAGLVAKETPFLLLVTLAALPQVPVRRAGLLGASLGYGRVAAFVLLAWPSVYRQIRLAVFAVIAFSTSVVDVSIILGPSVPPTLPVRLVQWMNDPDLSKRFLACAGACLQIAITVAALAVWLAGERLAAAATRFWLARGWRLRADGLLRRTALTAIAVPTLAVFGGLALLALWSVAGFWRFPDLAPQEFTLQTWTRNLPGMAAPLSTTLFLGLAATVLATLLVTGCLLREGQTGRSGGARALALVYLPLLVPQIGFLFGLQFLFIMAGLDATWPSLVLAHMVFVLPYVFLSLSAPWRAYDVRNEQMAAALGKPAWTIFWRVRLPMMLPAVLAAMAVGFAVSVGQYLPTLLVGAGRFSTITTEAVALGTGGNRRVIAVYGFMQTLLPFIAFGLATAVPALLYRNRRAITGR